MNNTITEQLMSSERFRAGLIESLLDNASKTSSDVDIFTKNELEELGFAVVNTPCFELNGRSYTCVSRKIINFRPRSDFDFTADKNKALIVEHLRNQGFTHLYKVQAYLCRFSFDFETITDAVAVLAKGASIKLK